MKQIMRLGFESLRVSCIIGVLEHERQMEQDLLIDCSVALLGDPSFSDDDLTQTLDYRQLLEGIRALAIEGRFQLLEALAIRALDVLGAAHPLSWARITIRKPAAFLDAASSFVELEREYQV